MTQSFLIPPPRASIGHNLEHGCYMQGVQELQLSQFGPEGKELAGQLQKGRGVYVIILAYFNNLGFVFQVKEKERWETLIRAILCSLLT